MSNIPTSKELWERKQQQIVEQRNQYKKVPTIGEILEEKLGQKKKEVNKQQSPEGVSSIELPSDVVQLITGSDYWIRAKRNRYLKLLRDSEITLQDMLKLASMAKSKQNAANWFASVMSKAKWERTVAFLKKSTVEIARKAQIIADRLGVKVNAFILKQVWRCPKAEYYATQAEEIGRNKMKLFAWLCLHNI